ncbi:MAG TPA: hypothetical protein VIM58_03345 [Candidatus Methylacidiphilales bacterium]
MAAPAPISSKAGSSNVVSWIFIALFGAIPLFALVHMASAREKTPIVAVLVCLLFLAISGGLAYGLIRQRRIFARYGESFFQPPTEDFSVGGPLRGTVSFSPTAPVRPGPDFVVTLSSIRSRTTGSGKDRSTSRTTLWEEKRSARTGADGFLPVSFLLPDDAEETQGNANDGVAWKIEVREAQDRDLPFSASFPVVVRKRELTPEELTAAAPARAEHAREVAAYRLPADSRIAIRSCGIDDTEFYFPPGLNRKVGLTNLPLFLAFGGVAAFLWFHAPVFFAAIFALIAAILFYATLQTFFGSMRTVAGRDGITVTRSLLGWTRTRRLSATSIKQFKTAVRMTSGKTAYRTALAVLADGNEAALSPNLADATEAEWLAAEIEKKVRG